MKFFKVLMLMFGMSGLFFNCTDPQRPFPETGVGVINNGDASSDQADLGFGGRDPNADVPATGLNASRIPSTDNGYICYCRFQVPLSCIASGCGMITTGTSITPDNFCDVGVREVGVCIPGNVTSPTFQEVENDCTGRVEQTLRAGLHASYPNCGERCNIRYGCTAIRLDGTVRSLRTDRCLTDCSTVPLIRNPSDNSLNYEQATYIPVETQIACQDEVLYPTPHLCAWH